MHRLFTIPNFSVKDQGGKIDISSIAKCKYCVVNGADGINGKIAKTLR